jgi:hypothetical protein
VKAHGLCVLIAQNIHIKINALIAKRQAKARLLGIPPRRPASLKKKLKKIRQKLDLGNVNKAKALAVSGAVFELGNTMNRIKLRP